MKNLNKLELNASGAESMESMAYAASGGEYHPSGGDTGGGDDDYYNPPPINPPLPPILKIIDPHNYFADAKKRLFAGIEDLKTKQKDKNLTAVELGDVNKQLANLQRILSLFTSLESNRDFRLRVERILENKDGINEAYTEYDEIKKEYLINMELSPLSIDALLVHKLTHAYDLLKGNLWYESGELQGHDIYDEVRAYQNQHDVEYGLLSTKYDLYGRPVKGGNFKVTEDEACWLVSGDYEVISYEHISKPK